MKAYAAEATEAYIEDEAHRSGLGVQGTQTAAANYAEAKQTAIEVTPAAEVKADVASEVLPAEKPKRRRAPAAEEVKPIIESAETATADQSAVIAEAKAEAEAPWVDETPAAMKEDAADVKVETIRAIAKKFNTDELRAVAMAILTKHAAASVTALAERDNIIRVSALRDFEAAAQEHNLA